jgi:hypothetical protein
MVSVVVVGALVVVIVGASVDCGCGRFGSCCARLAYWASCASESPGNCFYTTAQFVVGAYVVVVGALVLVEVPWLLW